MITRSIEPVLRKISEQFGVISIVGPRQSGKTTLAKKCFPDHKYVNLESPSQLTLIAEDPQGFIEDLDGGVIIDEVQRFPELLSYIQVAIDEKFVPSKFIVTGSENLVLSEKVSQTLAGRVAMINLLPLSMTEISSTGKALSVSQQIVQGFYPSVIAGAKDHSFFYSNYIATYIERDVRQITSVGDLSRFRRFMQLLAGRIGQLVNLSSIGNDLGVSHNTIESWISILEASYIVFRLQPYHKNYGKRVIKTPKIYFYDVGLACSLLAIDSEQELNNFHARGSLFENMVITNVQKEIYNTYSSSRLYFWRDRTGNEIDLLIDAGTTLSTIEIKSSKTFNRQFLSALDKFSALPHESKINSFVVYAGTESQKIRQHELISWEDMSQVYKTSDIEIP